MYRAYKFRMYPNDGQKVLINKYIGCSKFIYNYYLTYIKDNKYLTANATISREPSGKYYVSVVVEIPSILTNICKPKI